MVQLLEPDPAYERSYDSYVQELHAAGAPPVPFTLGYDHAVFAALVERLRRPTTGGRWVPNSNYWLIEHGELVGVSNLRGSGGHIGYGVRPAARPRGRGTTLLRLTLQRAWARGIERVMITCDKHNAASAPVARNHAAELTWEGPVEGDGREIEQHYWIDLRAHLPGLAVGADGR